MQRQLQTPLFALDSQMSWNKNGLNSRAPRLAVSRAEVTPPCWAQEPRRAAGATADAPSAKYLEMSKDLFTELVDKHALSPLQKRNILTCKLLPFHCSLRHLNSETEQKGNIPQCPAMGRSPRSLVSRHPLRQVVTACPSVTLVCGPELTARGRKHVLRGFVCCQL